MERTNKAAGWMRTTTNEDGGASSKRLAHAERRDNARRDERIGRQARELRSQVEGRTQEEVAATAQLNATVAADFERGRRGRGENLCAACRLVEAVVMAIPAALAAQVDQLVESHRLSRATHRVDRPGESR